MGRRWDDDGTTMTELSFLALSQYFEAKPGAVFAAFTEPDLLAKWFGPPGLHAPRESVSVEPRAGGHWRLTMVSDDDATFTSGVNVTLVEFLAGELIVGIEDITGSIEGGVSTDNIVLLTVRVEFSPDGHGTMIKLRQGPFNPHMASRAHLGWSGSFLKLNALLSPGERLRAMPNFMSFDELEDL